MLDHPQNCFCNGNRTCNVGKDCTKAIPQGTTTFLSKNPPQMRVFERKLKNGKRCASIFYQVVIILSIHLISGCRITASIPAFQAGDGGSTPLSRSNGMNLTNSAQQRHRFLCSFWFLSRFKGCHGLGCPVVSGHYFDRVIEKLMGQLLPDKEFPSLSATLRSHPSVQICHPDHAPHPLHYTYQSRAVW